MATIGTSFLRLRRSAFPFHFDHQPSAPRQGGVLKVRTFLGWTPGLRGVVAGHVLACGCLIGVYETRSGDIVEVLDSRGPACPHAAHQTNAVIHGDPAVLG